MPILYTISAAGKGTPLGEVAAPLKRRESEPVLYPDAFDKFMGGALKAELDKRNCSLSNYCWLGDEFRRALHRDDGGADLSLRCGNTAGRGQRQADL